MTTQIRSMDRTVEFDGATYRVHGVQIASTDSVYFRAWEKTSPGSGHTTITSFGEGEGFWGTVASAGLPASIAALRPGSQERIDACREWQRIQNAIAAVIVFEAFPWLRDGRLVGDEVWTDAATVAEHEEQAR